ncbi:DEAD/DEAH box helicase [Lactiplantibacillus carotarum]|uniref:DEAD/DEAH box helicase n=1 Tax=Lactiplantibacillus carotarum TaxID=2993456 RepID=UPI00298F130B|nr:DEAD/DEAH box helicase [Lactiplantibacillus carotarum]
MEITKIQRQIADSLTNGLVDERVSGREALMPRFIYNKTGDTMFLHIERELDRCSKFTFVIAFVTESALTALKVKLADLSKRGIQGRILTSDYLDFNTPKVFHELQKLPNVEVRIAKMHTFHAKGYIFDHADEKYQSAIIGSSNLTATAMMTNYEWNLKFTSHENGALTAKLIQEVNQEWLQARPLSDAWITDYAQRYQTSPTKNLANEVTEDNDPYPVSGTIRPNVMQAEALSSLQTTRQDGHHKALIISATGTGKTYLGALDVANFKPHRFLYIVHREQILDKTIASFKKVLGNAIDGTFGKISGSQKDYDAKYLFATIQTLSQDDQLAKFAPNEFDYILIDEVHRAGAGSYQKVVNYFQPEFLLGMTATPERMDDFNLYEMFDYNIPYEIRLQNALDEKMLCPFRYIGITDYQQNDQVIEDTSQLQWLVSEERVNYIIHQTEYYGYSGEALRGLIFCSLTKEAYELADELTERGYASAAITGSMPQSQREAIVQKLEQGQLNYIITVDVFNEGVDIPCVNQIVMLRNTQSSIVFVQQLGRGLRKFAGKDYVTVIDFIGNYKNNYLIPIALTGDKSRSKNTARDDLEVRQIAGVSTVSFSEIAKQRIYQSINNTSLDSLKALRDDYQDLKQRLDRVPLLTDFQRLGSVDCTVFADKYKNYYQFLLKMKEDVHLTIDQEAILSFISIELMNGKRVTELLLLRDLIQHDGRFSKDDFEHELVQKHVFYNSKVESSVENVLSLAFFTKATRQKYGDQSIVELVGDLYRLNPSIWSQLNTSGLFKRLIEDALEAGCMQAERYQQDQPFTLYQRYTRKDACRLLGWPSDSSSTLYGYRVKENVCPIFVTYAKSDEIDDSIKYQDRFISTDTFQWYTRRA